MANSEIISDYLDQTKPSYQSKCSNVSFDGPMLYSYNSILAEIKSDHLLINKSIANYSNTSAKHTALLRKLNTLPVIELEGFKLSIESNIEAKSDLILDLIGIYNRARTTKLVHKGHIKHELNQINIIKQLFNVEYDMTHLTRELFKHKLLGD